MAFKITYEPVQYVHTFHRKTSRGLCSPYLTGVASTVLRLEVLDEEQEQAAILFNLILPAGSQWQPVLLPLHQHSRLRRLRKLTGQRGRPSLLSLYTLYLLLERWREFWRRDGYRSLRYVGVM